MPSSPPARPPGSPGRLLDAWRRIPEERRGVLLVSCFAAALFVPWLGAAGLWDPWEPHYAEVARQMLVRGDWAYPYWESAHFFSKPPLLAWLTASSMALFGAQDRALPAGAWPAGPTPSGLSAWTEWAVRLPVALLAVAACALTFVAVKRLVSRRAGCLAAGALATTPLYFLMARQATTDMPFVALVTSGAMCFAVALWDERAHRAAWAHAGYAFLGFAALAKGILGFALPCAAFLAWFLVTGDWRLLPRLRLVERVRGVPVPLGPALFLAIAAPWYVALSLFSGLDDEGKTFAYRFWIHDHLKRFAQGVHTTTPGGDFDYFIRQLGFGLFPWVAAVPGALGELCRLPLRARSRRDDLALFAGLWAVVAYAVMSFSATKFHHYALPAVPPLAVLCALFLDRVLDEGLEAHVGAVVLGATAYAVVAYGLWLTPKVIPDLFVYDYARPYPQRELAALHPGHRLGPFVLSLGAQPVLSTLFALGGAGMLAAWLWRSRRAMAAALLGLATAFAVHASWFHWRELSPHWSQRDLFRTYLAERGGPDEPIMAYLMNWRGETFYSRNLVRQVQDAERMRELAARRGRAWILVERGRYAALREAVGPKPKLRVADRSSNKYLLVELRQDG